MQRALNAWSIASNGTLEFVEISNKSSLPHLDIYFARFAHDDPEPFDGRGGIVAHSGYPMAGKVHFDASEYWTLRGGTGIDLRYVAMHELGHALGLRHSNDRNAVMHPRYKMIGDGDEEHLFRVGDDDVAGIRALYG